jgi:hypothetical protein
VLNLLHSFNCVIITNYMSRVFVPYAGDQPASLVINGHRLVIVSTDPRELSANLELLGGDSLKELDDWQLESEWEESLELLATAVGGGVVVAPEDSDLEEVIRSLESELPWIH